MILPDYINKVYMTMILYNIDIEINKATARFNMMESDKILGVPDYVECDKFILKYWFKNNNGT